MLDRACVFIFMMLIFTNVECMRGPKSIFDCCDNKTLNNRVVAYADAVINVRKIDVNHKRFTEEGVVRDLQFLNSTAETCELFPSLINESEFLEWYSRGKEISKVADFAEMCKKIFTDSSIENLKKAQVRMLLERVILLAEIVGDSLFVPSVFD